MFTIFDSIFNPTRVNPIEVAQQNEQEFMVRDVIAHHGDHHRRSSMEFLVRWTDYDASSNSWEPYKALMLVDKGAQDEIRTSISH